MKSLCRLALAVIFLVAGVSIATADTVPTTGQNVVQEVYVEYNQYGVGLTSTNTTTTTTITERMDDPTTTDRNESGIGVTVETATVTSSWHGGSLKTDSIKSISQTTGYGENGTKVDESISTYKDTYLYDASGSLVDVSSSGIYNSTEYADGQVTGGRTGSINRTYLIQDGQALLQSSVTEGVVTDKDGNVITGASFDNTTTVGNYAYMAGQWVPRLQRMTNNSYSADGGYVKIITYLIFVRDEETGVLTGMEQISSGEQKVITSAQGETPAGYINKYGDTDDNPYVATFAFDPVQGWYLRSEDYVWIQRTDLNGNPIDSIPSGTDDTTPTGGGDDTTPTGGGDDTTPTGGGDGTMSYEDFMDLWNQPMQ